jgi:hypothetical protein
VLRGPGAEARRDEGLQVTSLAQGTRPENGGTGLASVVFGRFMLPDMSEHACQVIDMGEDGAVFITGVVPPRGQPIVAYLEDLGRVEVISGLPVEGGFRVTYAFTGSRLERLRSRIDYLKQRAAGAPEQRRHTRFEPKDKHTNLTLPDGRSYPCEVLDISVSGCAVKTEIMPSLGTYLMVGKMKGRVVRYLENGVGVEFARQLDKVQLSAQAL